MNTPRSLGLLSILGALFLIGCGGKGGDDIAEAKMLSMAFHGKSDGTIAISRAGEMTTELAEFGGEQRHRFRIETDSYTVVGSVPLKWIDGKPNQLIVDTSQTAGVARYDFKVTADEGITRTLNEIPDGSNVMDAAGEWQLVMKNFTFTRSEAP